LGSCPKKRPERVESSVTQKDAPLWNSLGQPPVSRKEDTHNGEKKEPDWGRKKGKPQFPKKEFLVQRLVWLIRNV